MYEGYVKQQWDHTSAQMALVANLNRGKDTPAFSAAHFNPFGGKVSRGNPLDESAMEAWKKAIRARKKNRGG